MKKINFYLGFFLFFFALSVFSDLQAKSIAVIYIKGKVTPYKKAITDSIITNFPNDKILLIDHFDKKTFKPQDYQAIIVMDQLEAWTLFNSQLKKLSKSLDANKTLFLVTAGDPDWIWKKKGITAVTSASREDKLPSTWNKVKIFLEEKLK